MPYSMEEAMSAYGFVYALANSIPDLKAILDVAVRDKWTPERLTATIQSSQWYRYNSDGLRNIVQMQATDPGTYTQTVANATENIMLKAQQMGRSIDAGTAQRLALETLVGNASWDDQRLSMLIANNTGISRGDSGALAGQAASYFDHMSKVAESYGVDYSSDWLDSWVNEVESGRNTIEGFDAVIKARAKAAFPQFADLYDAGMTTRDIADPYIATYAKTLEVPETEVTLNSTYIQRALAQTGQDGMTRTSMPLWQFQRLLKDDPRYDSTQQAKDDAFSTLNKIGKDFGFVGTSA